MVTTNKITHTHSTAVRRSHFPITSSAQCTLALPLRPLRVYNNDSETIYSRTAGAQAMSVRLSLSVCVYLRASLSPPLNLFDMTDQADDEGINYLALQLYCSRCVYIVQRREPRPPPPELCERAQLLGLLFMYIYAFVPSLSLSNGYMQRGE